MTTTPAGLAWEPPSPEELQRLLPQFRIESLLGRGGMGAVYRALQNSLDREVAIKLLPPELGADPSFEARFKREAKAMARLNHANIVQIYDFGQTTQGHHYFVMEYVDGTDLLHLIRSGGLDAVGALNAVSQICDALEYAHSEGYVHRDIKPANIFINTKGILKVGDFGLAKLVDPSSHQNAASEALLTMTGVVMGTPQYIAPEQLEAEGHVDQRADIYSLGVMFYEMLTGAPPRGAVHSPSEYVKNLDVRIDGVVFKAMEPDPGLRYQSAADLRTDVDVIRTTPAQGIPTPRKTRPPKKVPMAVVVPLVLLLAAGMGLVVFQPWSRKLSTAQADPNSTASTPPFATKFAASPAGATKDVPFVNSLGMKFVPVPGTDVLFCIHETRWKDYEEYAKENPGIDGTWQNQTIDGFRLVEKSDDHPVVNVSWEDARTFCAWLSEKEGKPYRLPTDHEWSVAVGVGNLEDAAAGPKTKSMRLSVYPWGTGFPPPQGVGNFSDQSRKAKAPNPNAAYLEAFDDGFPTTAPVMSLTANGFGIYDLEGNVREWVEDWWDEAHDKHVLRGASWDVHDSDRLLSSRRTDPPVGLRCTHGGFRCVLQTGIPAKPEILPAARTPDQHSKASVAALRTGASRPDPALATATKDALFVNSLGMKFIPVPITGGPTGGQILLFSVWETRVKDYEKFVKDTGRSWPSPGCPQKDDHPAVNVSWEDAEAFCEWLTVEDRRKRKIGKDHRYRLPTDHEWSCAVGIGKEEDAGLLPVAKSMKKIAGVFPWGREWPPPKGAGNYYGEETKRNPMHHSPNYPQIEDYNDGFDRTAPVGSFEPNQYGLYDLGGNAWEWCADWFDTTNERRVARGGSWGVGVRDFLLSSNRGTQTPTFRKDDYFGFRVVAAASDTSITGVKSVVPAPRKLPETDRETSAPSPPTATKDKPFVNSLGMKFVSVPGTDVLFCIHETRWKDYAQYAHANPSIDKQWQNQTHDGFRLTERDEDHPAAYVSWEDATAFCKWLSEKEEKAYRLPKDHEWSVAVGIGSEEDATEAPIAKKEKVPGYPWGTQWPPPKGAGNYSDQSRKALAPRDAQQYLEGYDDGFPTTAPVMSFEANALGLYDLGGNVWEWCEDRVSPSSSSRVVRGSSWDGSGGLSSSNRGTPPLTARGSSIGFRVVIEAGVRTSKPEPVIGAPAPGQAPLASAVVPFEPAQATKDKPFVNSLGMQFVPVPGTDVLFCIHETRWKDYIEYAKANPGIDTTWQCQTLWGFRLTERPEDHPVVSVSWDDATAFSKWLSEKEKKTYRLATDQEWSAAVGLGRKEKWRRDDTSESVTKDQNEFPWSGNWPPPKGAGNYSDLSRAKLPDPSVKCLDGYEDGFPTTAPVMSFPPNVFGLYDLGGNAWEWVEDPWSEAKTERVLRGGSWTHYDRSNLLSSNRSHHTPDRRDNRIGFRVVLVASGASDREPVPGGPPPESASIHAMQPANAILAPPETRVTALTTNPTIGEVYTLNLGNDVTMELMGIPPGEFLLGSTKEEQAWAVANGCKEAHTTIEGTQPRKAEIKSGFWLSRTETTVAQWKQFVATTGYVTEAEECGAGSTTVYNPQKHAFELERGLNWRNPCDGVNPDDRYPVRVVTWNDAVAFCDWLTAQNQGRGQLPPRYQVRLPAEAEWEYACRAGMQTKYWWGDRPEDGRGRLNSKVVPRDPPRTLALVDSFGPLGRNGFGLADMLANVFEWCLDGFDPSGAHPECFIPNDQVHVTRSVGFRGDLFGIRCAARTSYQANFAQAQIGFRIAVGVDVTGDTKTKASGVPQSAPR